MNEIFEKAAEFIKDAKEIVVLTGAGMSTESGIPDFRSNTGIYTHNPEKMLSRQFFFEKPDIFYQFLFEKLYQIKAKPNIGHAMLSKWEKDGKEIEIITQNIDELHQKAGSAKVINFHGNINTATCANPKCQKKVLTKSLYKLAQSDTNFYKCSCGVKKGVFKSDVVLFGDIGEFMTRKHMDSIQEKVNSADLVLVLGTSLQVYPFASFIEEREKTVPMIIINKGDTPFDKDTNTYVINDFIGETLKKIDKTL